MNNISTSNKTIAKNTAFLYLRMFFSMGVGLYTSRVVLLTLGIEDFGIWNVVGGVIAMFSFLNTSMSGATSRFITFELGNGTDESLQKVFSAVMTIHTFIAAIVLILAESVGLWFVENKLVIPIGKMTAVLIVYQASIAVTVISIIQVPFRAVIMAYERMNVYAYVEMFHVAIKLMIVLILPLLPYNKLITYSILLFLVSLIVFFVYIYYSRSKFKCTNFIFTKDISLMKPLLSFSGWDLLGNASVMARTQGVNVLINLFFTTVVNAASGIATQVQSAVMSFAGNVLQAFRPQIIKNYAVGNIDKMENLINKASQYTTLLLLIFTIPLCLEINYVLKIWLKEVPQYAGIFCQLTLIFNIFANISGCVIIGVHATGNIKRPSLINGTLYLMVIPFSYCAYKIGFAPQTAYMFNILAVLIGALSNVCTLKLQIPEFRIKEYILNVFVKCFIISLITIVIGILINYQMQEGVERFVLTCMSCSACIGLLTFFFILNSNERKKIIIKIKH